MFFIFAWAGEGQDDHTFEDAVPLLFIGRRLRRFGDVERFIILFMDGYGRLSAEYLGRLRSLGWRVEDATAECARLADRFRNLARFGKFETLCFLRWPVLRRYLERERFNGHVVHVDADVLFNAPPRDVESDTRGRTFVLQGNPAFVSISEQSWLDHYEEELVDFDRDIESYSSMAWAGRPGWEESYRLRWAGFFNRPLLSSDQDFISYLIHARKLPQDDPAAFAQRSSLYYSENPLYVHSHATIQVGQGDGLEFTTDGRSCAIQGRTVALWHFQSAFSRYVQTRIALARFGYPYRVHNHLESRFGRWQAQLAGPFGPQTRNEMYGSVKQLNQDDAPGTLDLSQIFNRSSFWKPGIFANPPAAP